MSDGPVLAVIGDVHATWRRLDAVLGRIQAHQAHGRLDGVLFVGDLGSSDVGFAIRRTAHKDRLYRQSVARVLDTAREATGVPVLYVPGNHDLPDLDMPGNVDGRVARVGGLRVAGIGGAGPDMFGFCYEWPEHEVDERRVPACDVLLVHAPPRDTPLDRTESGKHVGSAAIRRRALAHHGVMVCGHIHESPGCIQLGDCLVMNVGGLGRPYGRARVGWIHGTDRVVFEDLLTTARTELVRAPAAAPG